MTSILSDSIAREHAADIQATASASRRVEEARRARRQSRRTGRTSRSDHRAESRTEPRSASHAAAARPFVAVHDWLAAGQL